MFQTRISSTDYSKIYEMLYWPVLSWNEQISFSPYGLYIFVSGIQLQQLLTDSDNNNLEGFDPFIDGRLPHLIVNLFIGKYFSRMAGEKVEHIKFKGGKVRKRVNKADAAAAWVDYEGAIVQWLWRCCIPAGTGCAPGPSAQAPEGCKVYRRNHRHRWKSL